MISPTLYLKLFNATFHDKLVGIEIKESDLPQGDRIVERIGRYLQNNSIALRQSGGYNHYLVATYIATNPSSTSKLDVQTINRFEKLFDTVNRLFG